MFEAAALREETYSQTAHPPEINNACQAPSSAPPPLANSSRDRISGSFFLTSIGRRRIPPATPVAPWPDDAAAGAMPADIDAPDGGPAPCLSPPSEQRQTVNSLSAASRRLPAARAAAVEKTKHPKSGGFRDLVTGSHSTQFLRSRIRGGSAGGERRKCSWSTGAHTAYGTPLTAP
eukprot:scaffold2751_cov110-Isochrysis_galbana.AAC.1